MFYFVSVRIEKVRMSYGFCLFLSALLKIWSDAYYYGFCPFLSFIMNVEMKFYKGSIKMLCDKNFVKVTSMMQIFRNLT